jgi:hypothetical protein
MKIFLYKSRLVQKKILESNIDIKKNKFINIKNKKILVLSLVNNCSGSVYYINHFIKDLLKSFEHIKFCFFTNNNKDQTNKILSNLARENKDLLILKYYDEDITTDNRIEKFAQYRNINFEYAIKYFGYDFDYVIVFDSDLHDYIPVQALIDSLSIDHQWSCISSNCCYKNSSYYYDYLALRLSKQSIDIKKIYPDFNMHYGHDESWLNRLLIMDGGWLKTKCAFGGLSIYHMNELYDIYEKYGNLYDISNLPPYSAEHISLSLKLKNDILINSNIRYQNNITIEGKMYKKSVAFVPRDAGFFSVFNFYIGGLAQGSRMYPLWNKEELIKLHGSNKHFAYWTENYNSWFDYFEPVKFFENDNTHLCDNYLALPRYSGEHGPPEFRIPAQTKELLKGDKEVFNRWRENTHTYYRRFIKLCPEISENIESIWNSLTKNINNQNIIGVHYRHPSHFVESGKIYLENYFNEIDNILSKYPESMIFLASDNNFGIYAFLEKYQNKIIYIDNIDRITMPEFLHWSFGLTEGKPDDVGFINNKGYDLHAQRVDKVNNKTTTTDLLKEVFCLSKCNQLIGCTSNIILAISYINPKIEIITL